MGFSNHPKMSEEAQRKHALFLDHVVNAEMGIKVPGLGLLTIKLLVNIARVSASVLFLSLPYVLYRNNVSFASCTRFMADHWSWFIPHNHTETNCTAAKA